ncbi:MAG: V-type ATPase 116kDa subunit family protein [Acutalibacteraceae bacterium]|nr:V-type ATPase 116kDa subunit family protein [Acutalibacteraceae bacterium]
MIEKMNLAYIVALEQNKDEMISALRDLGVVHISQKANADEKITNRFLLLQKLMSQLSDYAPKKNINTDILDDAEFEELFVKTKEALERKTELENIISSKRLLIDKLRAWGDFAPQQVKNLSDVGVDFHFYRIDKKELKRISENENIKYIKLAPVDKMDTIAVLGNHSDEINAVEFTLPEKGISELESDINVCNEELSLIVNTLHKSAEQLESYKAQIIKSQNDAEFSSVKNTAKVQDELVWIKGYFPISDTENFVSFAKNNGWAYLYETVEVDDGFVPTKVKYNKLTSLMKPIFDILGTVPGYGEYDISFCFLLFFTLFFAMIIGDAGYGIIFLIIAAVLTIKGKKFTNATLLLTVLSVATVFWGSVTGTWFGLEAAMKVPFLKSLVIPSFANYPQYFGMETTAVQNSVMKFCFSIGVIQLSLACVMNISRKIVKKDLSMLADFGWLLSIFALYFMVLFLVINQPVNLTLVAIFVFIGFLLVVLFGGMSPDKTFVQGLKSGLSDTFTVFLNTISAFGNVMSYIRLFAVGMASLAIAQSFNDMSSGFSGPMIIVGIIIAIVGHLMNIVMGLLSVVVHGVRLNLLEFSGQLGMEWSGKVYEPFKKLKSMKK